MKLLHQHAFRSSIARSSRTRSSRARSSIGWSAWLIVLAALLLVGCQPIQPEAASAAPSSSTTAESATETAAEIPQITITAQDDAFEMPDELPAGFVSITFANGGTLNHHGFVLRLLEGVTLEQAAEAMKADMEGSEASSENEIYDLAFFLPDTDPGTTNQATVELVPGQWMIVSFSMDAASDGPPVPDWAKGLIKQFSVVETSGVAAVAPEADLVVTIGADDFEMPSEVAPGEQTLQIVNATGAADGYAFVVKLGEDTTMEDVLAAFEAMFAGQEPEKMPVISTVGGLMGYNLSDSFYTTINFSPGNYTIISSIGADELPYTGLYKSFTVQ